MTQFAAGHATHPNWQACVELVLAQLPGKQNAQSAQPARPAPGMAFLGLVYLTDHFSANAQGIVDLLRQRLPQVAAFAGAVGVGVCGNNAEYIDEPALSLMLAELPEESFKVFSGVSPLGKFAATTALVHAEGRTPDLGELIAELAGRTASGQVFGGLAASRMRTDADPEASTAYQIAVRADSPAQTGVFAGGLSGVSFSQAAGLLARVTHGCEAISPSRRVTDCFRNVVKTLDFEPALDLLLRDVGLPATALASGEPRDAVLQLQRVLVAIDELPNARPGKKHAFSPQTRVRHLVGIDPPSGAVAVAERLEVGQSLAFCVRNVDAARKDLVRICSELREALEPQTISPAQATAITSAVGDLASPLGQGNGRTQSSRIQGAVYISCAGRGGPHFGGPSAELQRVAHALGDVPLVGFFAGGEIAHQQIHSYTGVLLVFADSAVEASAVGAA